MFGVFAEQIKEDQFGLVVMVEKVTVASFGEYCILNVLLLKFGSLFLQQSRVNNEVQDLVGLHEVPGNGLHVSLHQQSEVLLMFEMRNNHFHHLQKAVFQTKQSQLSPDFLFRDSFFRILLRPRFLELL